MTERKSQRQAEGRADTGTPPLRRPSPPGSDAPSAKTKPVRSTTGIDVSGTGKVQTVSVRGHDTINKLFGTDDSDMATALLHQCLNVLSASEMTDDNPGRDQRQFMLATVSDIAPRDGVERMLAVQMAATHVAFVRSAQRMANAEYLPQFEANERVMTKMARSYTAQMEALRKHRNGGKQTVTVQHVSVADGGQAIVGNVRTGGRDTDET